MAFLPLSVNAYAMQKNKTAITWVSAHFSKVLMHVTPKSIHWQGPSVGGFEKTTFGRWWGHEGKPQRTFCPSQAKTWKGSTVLDPECRPPLDTRPAATLTPDISSCRTERNGCLFFIGYLVPGNFVSAAQMGQRRLHSRTVTFLLSCHIS